MWLLGILPEQLIQYIIYGMFMLGITSYLASFFSNLLPILASYKPLLNLASAVCIVFGIYLYGCNDTEQYWRKKVADANAEHAAEIVKAKEELKDATTQILIEQQKTKDAIEHQRVIIKDRILTITERIDSTCKVDNSAIQILNDAAIYPIK